MNRKGSGEVTKERVYSILYYLLILCLVVGMVFWPKYLNVFTVGCYILLIGDLVVRWIGKKLSLGRVAFLIVYATIILLIR